MELESNAIDGDNVKATEPKDASPRFRLRSYQAEMVEESLKSNIIVAMDTGSGKTHIALERTATELETCDRNQLVWFLAPTVALCDQQAKVFKSNLPSYGLQVLSGRDDIDHWTDQSTWDAIFNNIRIVISTHQVLLDALTHGFVKMSTLALIIFDEAHHCTRRHPANTILAQFYIPYIHDGISQLPRILGLSASPVQKATASGSDLQEIEKNMNATAKTPKINRQELMRFVHRPELLRIDYPITIISLPSSLAALKAEFDNYDLRTDPYVLSLLAQKNQGYDISRQLEKVFRSRNTYCSQQLKLLLSKSKDMAQELGISAAEWYLTQCVSEFEKTAQGSFQQLIEWTHDEREHLATILRRIPLAQRGKSRTQLLLSISPKVEALVDVLVSEAGPGLTGLVFIEQRVWVAALLEILTTHPKTQGKFNIGTFVGSSQSSKRKVNIANFTEPRNQQETLDQFRAGEINLILATSVLEEGIDVSSCHLVICFERPKNLKSFIQRRGRARKQESKYFIFLPETGASRPPESWELLEEEMKKAYLNDHRKVELAKKREEEEEVGERFYHVESTGALLTLENAPQHLHHFCAILNSSVYVDPRPQFEFEKVGKNLMIAKVTLPLSVIPAVRTAKSLELWSTERMAVKDASFEAYVALHKAGLVNDNLLPSREEADDQAAEFQIPDNTPALVSVSATLDPWNPANFRQQERQDMFHRRLLKLERPGDGSMFMVLVTPVSIPIPPILTFHWNFETQFSVECSWLPSDHLTEQEIVKMQSITRMVLHTAFSAKMSDARSDFLWLLLPANSSQYLWDHEMLASWHEDMKSHHPASELLHQGHHDASSWGLISLEGDLRKFLPKDILQRSSDSRSALGPCIKAIRFPRRRDFLHPVANQSDQNKNNAYTKVEELDASKCLVEKLPAAYAVFALLAPSIIYRLETYLIANTLRLSLLEPLSLQVTHLPLILQALTASVTGEGSNYQRLEFLGDCILKYIASVHLMAANPEWPESFLTGKKGKIVSNGFAARSAMSLGLDRFILTKRFTGAKWAPRYMSDIQDSEPTESKRTLSSKIIADVVESLIGVSYLTGGFSTAFTCIETLLPSEKWTPLPEARVKLYESSPENVGITSLSTLESLVGYTFNKKMLLLEALTHASYTGLLANCSYERLEFLGDAILDYIIVKRLYAKSPELSHQKMHGIRSAMVNASFLTFRMFETSIFEQRTNTSTLRKEGHERCLWQFLRAGSYELQSSRDLAIKQHREVRETVLQSMDKDDRFPWHRLALTNPPKFLSDIVESVLGAIYVDSHGDIDSCEIFIRRLGILDCLERILSDGVDCLHPKERVGHLAVERDVQYVRVQDEDGESKDGKGGVRKMYKVRVKVGGEDVGGVEEGLGRLNAETVAAWMAVGILEDRQDEDKDVDTDEEAEEWFDADDGGGIDIRRVDV
ncbi:P-loop containing nucleoside triphosphate hydrolase protein [Massarina eburnea CBS 473.64]|uniref:P-loop containing nucleoside triphosphate hydrolase protein n=1 Tax=Massarina eburnea CBS 473.64 TaxID=1395130 RepID=A0A6A6RYF1_9PLEO|nr:P-loop containing nucleoside triphosphate hydrolase protein [Massarina eburnea CBS 473.64]